MSDMRVVNSLTDSAWRRFIAENPRSSIFHTPEMFQVFARTRGYEPYLWAVVEQNEQPLALLLPVHISVLSGPMRFLTTRAIVFGGVLCQTSAQGTRALDLLLRTYAAESSRVPIFTELRNLWDMQELLPVLVENGFKYEAHLNYLLDLSVSPDVVLQRISQRTRKRIRQAIRRGLLQVEQLNDLAQLDECYDLLQKTYKNARVPLADISLFEAAFEVLYPKDMIRFTIARVGDASAAVSVELMHKDVVYGWYGGMDRAYSKYSSNEFLMWRILEWGAESGYRIYDFGGAGKPDDEYGVRDFKAKFGGELVCFGRNIFVHAPLRLWLSTLGYAVLRRFFS